MTTEDLLSLLDDYMRERLRDARTTLDMCNMRIEAQRQYQAMLRLEQAWFQLRGKS